MDTALPFSNTVNCVDKLSIIKILIIIMICTITQWCYNYEKCLNTVSVKYYIIG